MVSFLTQRFEFSSFYHTQAGPIPEGAMKQIIEKFCFDVATRAIMVACFLLACTGTIATAQEIPRELRDVFANINDDKIPYNDSLIVVGNENAKVTAVLFYAQACTDSEYFLRNVFPDLKKDFIDTGKLRLVFYEYPLDWKDMQALAGLRCVPKEKHLDALLEAARTNRARIFRTTQISSVPDQYTSVLVKFGLSADQALKCMRNSEVIGFLEGQRRLAVDQWNIVETPTLLIGDQTFKNIERKDAMYEVLKKFVN
jgi:hypothetical protein